MAALQTHSAPVTKITIIPRTSGALGYTMQVDENDHNLMSKEELENRVATYTGGRVAEELVFKSITTGASNDIEQATKLVRAMVTRFGMTEEFGMVALETLSNKYLGGDTSLACSENTSGRIDEMVVAIVAAQYEKAKQLISENMIKLHEIAKYLYEKETITGDEFMEILNRAPEEMTATKFEDKAYEEYVEEQTVEAMVEEAVEDAEAIEIAEAVKEEIEIAEEDEEFDDFSDVVDSDGSLPPSEEE